MQYLFYKGEIIDLNDIDRILKYERNNEEYVMRLQLKNKETINFVFDNQIDRDEGYDEVIGYIR